MEDCVKLTRKLFVDGSMALIAGFDPTIYGVPEDESDTIVPAELSAMIYTVLVVVPLMSKGEVTCLIRVVPSLE